MDALEAIRWRRGKPFIKFDKKEDGTDSRVLVLIAPGGPSFGPNYSIAITEDSIMEVSEGEMYKFGHDRENVVGAAESIKDLKRNLSDNRGWRLEIGFDEFSKAPILTVTDQRGFGKGRFSLRKNPQINDRIVRNALERSINPAKGPYELRVRPAREIATAERLVFRIADLPRKKKS